MGARADQLDDRGERFTEEAWGWLGLEQNKLGAAAEGSGPGPGVWKLSGLPFSRGAAGRLFPQKRPLLLEPGTSHGPLWASASPHEIGLNPNRKLFQHEANTLISNSFIQSRASLSVKEATWTPGSIWGQDFPQLLFCPGLWQPSQEWCKGTSVETRGSKELQFESRGSAILPKLLHP